MDLDGNIHIQNYVYHFLKEMDDLYSIANKNVAFMFYEPNLDNAKAVLHFGANKVIFVNPDYKYSEIEDGKIILLPAKDDKFSELSDNSVDLVIGLEILEHINDLQSFFSEIKRIVKPSGDVELQGNPMWTCHHGHHLWIENKYIFYEDSNPFEPWEHLLYDNQKDMEKALLKKGLPKYDSKEIARWIYDPIEISRHTPTEIIEAATGISSNSESVSKSSMASALFETYRTDGWEYVYKRFYHKSDKNECYEQAAEKYSEVDLNTTRVVLKMKHLYEQNYDNSFETRELPDLPHAVSDIFVPFNKKHNCANLTVLNLSFYENDMISQAFSAMGAKSVFAVSPTIKNDKAEKKNGINKYSVRFEDFETVGLKFDIVFGLDVINNIVDLDKFLINLSKVINNDTAIYMNGFMPYTSPVGHLIYTEKHKFIDETNPLKYWQHLSFENDEQFVSALISNGVEEGEARYIVNKYNEKGTLIKISPTELSECFNKYIRVNLLRIFKYFPKNEFYEVAKTKYSEEDLNTERIIISTDYPTLQWFDEVDMDSYLKSNLSDINLKYKLEGKKVLNISPYINLMITEGIEAFRVKEVVSLNSHYSGFELKGGKNSRRVNQDIEDLDNFDEQFDIIYGLDVLEHVKDLRKFYLNLKRLISDNGVICLQGSPLWPSDNGHNCMLNLDCGVLKTGEGYPCLEPWEHLAYETKEELKNVMKNKGFTENDAETVSEFIFNSHEINRKSYVDFIETLNEIDGIYYGSKKILHYAEENEFYQKANKKYTHEELRTKELKLFIRKKLC